MPDDDSWNDLTDFLFENFSKDGIGFKEARNKAKAHNIWRKVGCSFKEVETSLREHFSLVARGEVAETAGYPQVRLSWRKKIYF